MGGQGASSQRRRPVGSAQYMTTSLVACAVGFLSHIDNAFTATVLLRHLGHWLFISNAASESLDPCMPQRQLEVGRLTVARMAASELGAAAVIVTRAFAGTPEAQSLRNIRCIPMTPNCILLLGTSIAIVRFQHAS